MTYRFIRNYYYRWPSGAHTDYRAGMELVLKREVVDKLLPLGVIERVTPSGRK